MTKKIFETSVRHLGAKEREDLGVVLSDSGFSEYLTIRDIDSILKAMYKKYDSGYFLEQSARLGLSKDKKVKEFSTGMKAKLKLLGTEP